MTEIPPVPDDYADFVSLVEYYESTSDDTISYVVELRREFPAKERGKILLDLECDLCSINPRVRVWHVALGDKNSLRNLRGISIN